MFRWPWHECRLSLALVAGFMGGMERRMVLARRMDTQSIRAFVNLLEVVIGAWGALSLC